MARRKAATTWSGISHRPMFIWEPVPDLPNHSELAGLMGGDGLDLETGEVSARSIERACEQLLASMPLQSYALVVRAAERGCYIAKNGGKKCRQISGILAKQDRGCIHGSLQSDTDMEAVSAGLLQDEDGAVAREKIEVDLGIKKWVSAYHQDNLKVVDATGGGNAFLGGLSLALARGEKLEDAVAWASVAASFAIEQVGMPNLQTGLDSVETWNGKQVLERLHEFQRKFA
ncbi:hypothetical protein E4U30_000508 [Claviceps sp. LM220 group G6]|nr:hypothetical protein E4U30_000508 [Claviceps sp. LM220 group G6]KAG6097686.1 hypothetical protein E4U31_005022 [Claviceps sp. LM219 group G6]